MNKKNISTYKIWIERRIVHGLEIKGEGLTPEAAKDIAYKSQLKGANCLKHSPKEKKACTTYVEIADIELWDSENKQWKVLDT
tara:strand:+ start:1458 stop:1706 length:249 start_codon:yes stop_codon:yes gene_type:complete